MTLPSRPVALAVIGVAGVLGLAAWGIVRHTGARRAATEDTAALAAATATPAQREAVAVATTTSLPRPAAPTPSVIASAEAERALALEIRSLVAAGKIGAARARANAYYARFPDGPAAPDLERLTGAHPTRETSAGRDPTDTRP
jgi:hypothetical protein